MHLADLQDFFTIFPSLGKYFQVLHNVLTAPECNIKKISQGIPVIPDTTITRYNIPWVRTKSLLIPHKDFSQISFYFFKYLNKCAAFS